MSKGVTVDPDDTQSPRYTTIEAAAKATHWRRLVSAGAAEVAPATIRSWACRGHIKPAGLDDRGRPLYDHDDLVRAELATRAHALRMVGIGTH